SAEAVYHGRPREPGTNIDHLWIRVSDLEASRRFYTTIAPVVGLSMNEDGRWGVGVLAQDRSFTLLSGEPTTDVHMAFAVSDDAIVREFHRVAVEAGYRNYGPPGERPIYHPGYYGAFVL